MSPPPSDPRPARDFLLSLWTAAIGAVGAERLRDYFPEPPKGRLIVIGAGKAAAAMAVEAARHYGRAAAGLAVTRQDYGLKPGESAGAIRVIEASHPVPDDAALEAGRAALKAVHGLSPEDLVLCLVSGGGSSLLEAPLPGVTLADIAALNKALLKSGATIFEMNCVRKHVSAIKGGRLAAAAFPARVVTLAISDVPSDDPGTIASGPSFADATTRDEARAILDAYAIAVAPNIAAVLNDPQYETLKPGDHRLAQCEYHLIATQADALAAAAALARQAGYDVIDRGTDIEGEAAAVAQEEAQIAQDCTAPTVILGGGELTVTFEAAGSGGPNREYALALALALQGNEGIAALAADTDGMDGTADGAGAFVFPDTLERAAAQGLDAQAMLASHDSGGFFASLGDALVPGPTRTNVSDFRAILVEP